MAGISPQNHRTSDIIAIARESAPDMSGSRLWSRIAKTLPDRPFKVPEVELFNKPQVKVPPRPSKKAKAFDKEAPTPVSHRPVDTSEKDWVATPFNGMIPGIFTAIIFFALVDKYLYTLPTPNDGEFGPMRYANDPDAKYWGDYRRDIQPRKGRRHLDSQGL